MNKKSNKVESEKAPPKESKTDRLLAQLEEEKHSW